MVDAALGEILKQGDVLERSFGDQLEGMAFFFTRSALFAQRRFTQARSPARRGDRGRGSGKGGGVEPGSLQVLERIADIAGAELAHEVDDVSAAGNPVVEPDVLDGIDLERRVGVPLADRAMIPQFPASHAGPLGAEPLTRKVGVYRDASCLFGIHRSDVTRIRGFGC